MLSPNDHSSGEEIRQRTSVSGIVKPRMEIANECGVSRGLFYRVFGLTYMSYTIIYITRKALAAAKPYMNGDTSFKPPLSPHFLGSIDTAFLLSYAVFQVFLPALTDTWGSRRFLCAAMAVAGGCSILFSLSNTRGFLLAMWLVEGIAHAPVFSVLIQIVGQVVPAGGRAYYYGLWTTSQQVGGIVATSLATFLCNHYGWKQAFSIAGLITMSQVLVLSFFLPSEKKLSKSTSDDLENAPVKAASKEQVAVETISPIKSFVDALKIPNLVLCGIVYFSIKLIRYAMLFWLPFFLVEEFHLDRSTAGYASLMFDFGGVFGAIMAGRFSDGPMGGRRLTTAGVASIMSAFLIIFLALLCPSSPVDTGVSSSHLVLGVILMLGFMTSGADSIMGAASPQEVVTRHQRMTKSTAVTSVSTAAGIINGIGSFGGMLQGILCPMLTEGVGWAGFFLFLGAAGIAGIFALIPSVRHEMLYPNINSPPRQK